MLEFYDGILGSDFLRENMFNVNYNIDVLENCDFKIDLLYKNKINYIKPRTEVFRLMKIESDSSEKQLLVESCCYHGILIPRCIIERNDESFAWISMCNISNVKNNIDFSIEAKPLTNFNIIGESNLYDKVENKISFNDEVLNIFYTEDRLGEILKSVRVSHLNNEEKEELFKIIKKYENIFSLNNEKLSATNVVKHKIRTVDTAPINTKTYRYPKVHEEEVRKQIEVLKNDGIIRNSVSPWNAPLWVVPKKKDATGNQKWRMVIDYRKLNEVTISDNYPIPNISEILDQLGKSKYFSVLDLKSGFHQIPVEEVDIEKTAFSTPYGHFEFTRMPFGLKNAPSCFQRLMNTVLAGLQGIKCFVYLDDIVVYGQNLNEHNEKLCDVLKQLEKANLKVQLDKCEFLKKEVTYLGHTITNAGVEPDKNKVEAIKKFRPPTNVKEVKSFLGMIGYYRKFIKNFSILASPINKLLKKNNKFMWENAQQEAFEKLKSELENFTILQYPDYTKQFVITTDASGHGIGAVLSQEINGKDLPIQFISRTLNRAEKNYHTTEQECLGIVWAVKQFRPYVYGRNFIIRTDHRPLQWLFNVKDPGSRLIRWRLKLEEYEYKIEYKKGKDNKVADELSRNVYITEEENEKLEETLKEIFGDDNNDDILNNDEHEVDNELSLEGDENFENPRRGIEEIVDIELRKKIISENHNSLIGGHSGQKATIAKIREKYHWKNLNREVIDFIQNCDECQTEKINRQPHRNPMTIVSNANHCLEKIAIDVVGPYKESRNKNYYGLTIQDDLSKFIKFIPMPNKEMTTVAKSLVENWILNFGIPKIILSDNGSEFCNSLMSEISKLFGFKHITTSVAYPQSNGSVERAHARLNEYLRLIGKNLENNKNWDNHMKYASFCYNTTVHSTTGFTPHELLFGRKANKPSEIDYEIIETINDYSEELQKNLIGMEVKAKNRLTQQKEKSKIRYDRNLGKQYNYKIGDSVLVRNNFKGKLDSVYRGPHRIVFVDKYNVLVKKNNKRVKYNKAHIKPFAGSSTLGTQS